MYSLKRTEGHRQSGLRLLYISPAFCLVYPNSYTQFLNNNCEGLGKELEMTIGVPGPRSHYSLNTLRIMKLGQGRAEMENCAVEVH